jgi:hypothetical protein
MIKKQKIETWQNKINYLNSFEDIIRYDLKPFSIIEIQRTRFVILKRLYSHVKETDIDIWGFVLLEFENNRTLEILFTDDNQLPDLKKMGKPNGKN